MTKHTDTITKKTLTKTLKHALSNIETSKKYKASKLLNQASDKKK